jgi:hypothetical protein
MTMKKNHIESLSAVAASLPGCIAKLEASRAEIAGKMDALKGRGLIYATEHMKDGKYLTLLYPIQPGEPRRREYVGKDPQKMQEAREAIQRAKDYEALAAQAKRLDVVLYDGLGKLQDAARVLARLL